MIGYETGNFSIGTEPFDAELMRNSRRFIHGKQIYDIEFSTPTDRIGLSICVSGISY